MFRKHTWLPLLLAIFMLLTACGPKEAVVDTPPPSRTPRPTPTLRTLPPSPSPTPEPIPDPVCILRGEEIVSLCDSAFAHEAMLTANGKLLAWRETPFDQEQCVLRQDNGVYLDVYELPLENITGAWLGRTSILALDKDGVLWGLGGNLHGQLWDAPEHDGWTTPQKLTDHVVSASISDWSYSAAIKDDGGVWLMGCGTDMTEETYLPPTRITEIKGAAEIYVNRFLYVRDKDGVSWMVGDLKELLDDPTAVTLEPYPGMRWLRNGFWLSEEGELFHRLPHGDDRTLLTNVADVDLSYDGYATAVTRDGDLYVWNAYASDEYNSLTVYTPTKVMEGVKLAGAWEHGVTVVLEEDGSVWAVYAGSLNAAATDGRLIELPA